MLSTILKQLLRTKLQGSIGKRQFSVGQVVFFDLQCSQEKKEQKDEKLTVFAASKRTAMRASSSVGGVREPIN